VVRAVSSNGTSRASSEASATTPVAIHFSLAISPSSPSSVPAGSANDLIVTALDNSNAVQTGFTGNVLINVSDGQPPLDGTVITFTGSNAGVYTLSNLATFQTLGNLTITATATANTSYTGSLGITVIGVVQINPSPLQATVNTAGTQ